MSEFSSAEQVTRKSGSNLALAFVLLPPERRRDITTFYAFCRLIDDLVDAEDRSIPQKQAGLDRWRQLLFQPEALAPAGSPALPEDLVPASLAESIRALISKYQIPVTHFEELIAGVEMDLLPVRYETWEALQKYCYRVASVVGLICIEIFGYRNPRSREYAIQLGYALQLTNIIRDVAKDARNDGRIYLPQDELAHFGVTADSILDRRPSDEFASLMFFQSERAHALYEAARALLPPEDRRSMVAAETMRLVYSRLLRKIEDDGFRVFERDYSLSKGEKIGIVTRVFLGNLIGGKPRRLAASHA